MPVHMGPFQKAVALDHAVEFIARQKIILAAMLFLSARRPRGVGDRRLHAGVDFQQGFDKAGFAGAAGRCNNKQVSWIVHKNESGLYRAVNGVSN